MDWKEISGILNIVLTLTVIFQWIDRRTRQKWLENTLYALHEMSKRVADLSERQAIKQKSEDLLSVIRHAIKTIDGSQNQVKDE